MRGLDPSPLTGSHAIRRRRPILALLERRNGDLPSPGRQSTRAPASRASHARRVFLIAALAVATLLGCGEQRGGDASRVAIGEPDALVVVPSLDTLREGLVAFLAGVEGTSGVLELVAARYGVDLTSAAGLRAAGIDPASPFVASLDDGALAVAVGVSDTERFLTLVRDRAVRLSGGREHPRAAADGPHGVDGPSVAAAPDAPPAWRAAYGVTADHIGLVVIAPAAADPDVLWRRHAAGDGAALTTAAATRARNAAGDDAVAWGLVADAPLPVPDGLGLVGTFIGPPIRGLAAWSFDARVTPERLSLRATVDQVGDATLPVSWLRPEGPADAFAAVFPKTTAAFFRGRFDVARVRKVPAILRRRFMPATLPGPAATLPLPPLDDILAFVDGDFAVALLGMDPDATVQQLLGAARQPRLLARVVRLALGARVHDPERAHSAFAAIAAQLGTSGWTVDALDGGGYRGFTFHRGAEAYSALIGHGVVLFIVGKGEVEPFVAVAEERALALSAAATDEPAVARAIGLTPATAGALFGFTRVTRELADKGVPPYFLKIINDIRVLALTADVAETRVTLELEVAL